MGNSIIDRLKQAGITITRESPGLISASPADRLTDELRQLIRSNKPALLAMLEAKHDGRTIRPAGLSKKLVNASLALDCQLAEDDACRAAQGLLVRYRLPKPVFIEPPPQHPTTPIPAFKTAKPMPWLHADAPWRMAARDYYLHHAQCQQCQGAGQGRGNRCDAGLDLWQAYQAAESAINGGAHH